MLKGIHWFIERLAERVVALVATSVSSAVQTQHALTQASQQGQLEDAARRYEQEGMDEIAATLRRRASSLASTDPAAESLAILDKVSADVGAPSNDPPRLPAGSKDLAQLPDLSKAPGRSRSKTSKKLRGANSDED